MYHLSSNGQVLAEAQRVHENARNELRFYSQAGSTKELRDAGYEADLRLQTLSFEFKFALLTCDFPYDF